MRRLALTLAAVLLAATPALAFDDQEVHVEVPAGWTASGMKAPGAVVRMAPTGSGGGQAIQVWRIPAGKPRVVPPSARAGSTKLGGQPAASFVWEETDPRKPMSAARVHVLVTAKRGGKTWEIRADYDKPAGDLSVDRRWNTAMSLIVRGWRWKT